MSLELFSKNLKYLRHKNGLKGTQFVKAVNKLLKKEFKVSDDKLINRKRLGAYEEGRSYCPAYVLPVMCRVLKHRDTLSIFTIDLEQHDKNFSCETL